MEWLRRLDLRHLLLMVPWVVVGIVARSPITDNSFLWHIRAGTAQLETGKALTEDPFSFTMPGAPWRTQSWLADNLYGALEGAFGLRFAWVMVAVLGVLMLAAVAALVVDRIKAPPTIAVVLIATSVLMAAYLNPRPALFSILLMPLVMIGERDIRLRWTLPLLTWAWAALHGSWVIALAYVALQGLRRRRKHAVLDVSVMGLCSLFTAHGLGVLEVLLDFFRNRSALGLISEWGHPNLISIGLAPLFLAIVFLGYAGIKGRLEVRDYWIIVPFLALGLSSNRAVPMGWMTILPFAAAILRDPPEVRPGPSLAVLNVALLVGMLAVPFLVAGGSRLDPEAFPLEASTHLTSSRVFHDDTTGGFLIFDQWPQREVFIDDRAELYGELVEEFVNARGGRAIWRELFDRYGFDEALMRANDPLVVTLQLAGWEPTYSDANFVVLAKGDGGAPAGGPLKRSLVLGT